MWADRDRLVAPLVLIELECFGRFPHLGQNLRAGNVRDRDYDALFVHAKGVVLRMGRLGSVVSRVFFKLHDFDDDYFDGCNFFHVRALLMALKPVYISWPKNSYNLIN